MKMMDETSAAAAHAPLREVNGASARSRVAAHLDTLLGLLCVVDVRDENAIRTLGANLRSSRQMRMSRRRGGSGTVRLLLVRKHLRDVLSLLYGAFYGAHHVKRLLDTITVVDAADAHHRLGATCRQ